MTESEVIDPRRVYTRDEAAALIRMSVEEMDRMLEAAEIPVLDTEHGKVYLGETLLYFLGSEQYYPREILPNAVYSVAQVAKMLHVSDRTLRNLAGEGKLKPAKVGDHPVYLGEELLRFLKSSVAEPKRRRR
jgi:excisionase family DNA binding protein